MNDQQMKTGKVNILPKLFIIGLAIVLLMFNCRQPRNPAEKLGLTVGLNLASSWYYPVLTLPD
jgi:hypothetical protein